VSEAPVAVTVPAGEVTLFGWHWPGGGVPVLLVHGLASNARVWGDVGARLAAGGRQLLAVDLRGHGGSAAVPDPPGSDATLVGARDLAWVCASLRWPRVVVVAHSWGANIGLQLAADCPELVAGMVLVDGGWTSDSYPDDLDALWRVKAPPSLVGWTLEEVREVLAGAHPEWSAAAVEATLGNIEQRPDGSLSPWLTPERHRDRYASLLRHRPADLHARVRCRTVLLVAGDPPDPQASAAAAALPECELVAFAGGEHDLHLQFPAEVAGAVARLG
jgi:pimeloyl-ACP methyl ester carboxylesterase